MKRNDVARIIESKFNRYTAGVIEQIKGLPRECVATDDHETVWDDWKDQQQGQHYFNYGMYEALILGLCENVAKSLPDDEQQLLWLMSDAYYNGEADSPPGSSLLVEGLRDELFSRVNSIAADEPMDGPEESDVEDGSGEQAVLFEIEFVDPYDEADIRLQSQANEQRGKTLKTFFTGPPSKCGVCGADLSERKFFVDGKERNGVGWACMCAGCFLKLGAGIGWGQGQLYARTNRGKWLQVGGFPNS